VRDGAAIVRAEMRRATQEKPHKDEARHQQVRRLLTEHLWHDASDEELAKATGSTVAFVRRVRDELERDVQIGKVLTRARHAQQVLGYASVYDLLCDAVDVLVARGPERHGEAPDAGGAARGRATAESRQDDAAERERRAHLLATVRALRSRADHQALSGGGDSRSRTESAAYRETAAGAQRELLVKAGRNRRPAGENSR
jgi:hypothetical protein